MSELQRITNQALRAAFELRRSLSLTISEPIHSMELASRLGVDVRLEDCPSLEGMYLRDSRPRIFLPHSGHRPRGRLLFSCAHELGHHQLGHGTSADRYFSDEFGVSSKSPEEIAADTFASHLLMPRQAVVKSFERRRLPINNPAPLDCFLVSQELGVGFTTLLTQMSGGLRLLSYASASSLKKQKLAELRASIWFEARSSDLFVIDKHWIAATCNVTIADFIILPESMNNDGECVRKIANCAAYPGNAVYKVEKKGTQSLAVSDTISVTLRVAPQAFIGTYPNSYLLEPSDE